MRSLIIRASTDQTTVFPTYDLYYISHLPRSLDMRGGGHFIQVSIHISPLIYHKHAYCEFVYALLNPPTHLNLY